MRTTYPTTQRRSYNCIYGIVYNCSLRPLPCFETAASSINNIVMNENTAAHCKKIINLKTRSPFIGKTQQTKRTIAEKYVHCVRFFEFIFDNYFWQCPRFRSYFLSREYTYRDSEECYASVVHNGTENHRINNIKEAHVLGRLCWNFFYSFRQF
jgi:hypothetical protein